MLLTMLMLGLSITALFWWILRFRPRRSGGEVRVAKRELLYLTGVAITQLRPSGNAFINGKRVQVVSEGALIDEGASIRVVAVRGPRVVVRQM